MTIGGVLGRVTAILLDAEVPFMLVVSFASTAHGVPRTTHDIDVVIDPSSLEAIERLVAALPPAAYYVDLGAARDAYRRRSMFNVIDMATGWKIDLILRKAMPFSEEEFARRQPVMVEGVSVPAATAEDTVVAKLAWSARSGGSERQRRDVAGILATSAEQLDHAYIERWVAELGLQAEWAAARATEL